MNRSIIFSEANSAKICWKNSPLSRNSGQDERTRPGRGGHDSGPGQYEKESKNLSRKLYSLDHSYFVQHNALDFMFAQFRSRKLYSCQHHSSGPHIMSCGCDLIPRALSITSNIRFTVMTQPTRSCQPRIDDRLPVLSHILRLDSGTIVGSFTLQFFPSRNLRDAGVFVFGLVKPTHL